MRANVENHRATRDPGLFADSEQARSQRITDAAEMLRLEFIDALDADPQTLLSTRHIALRLSTPAEVIEDSFADPNNGDALLHELLQIVAAARRGDDVQLRADAWINAQAKAFGEWNASDVAAAAEESAP